MKMSAARLSVEPGLDPYDAVRRDRAQLASAAGGVVGLRLYAFAGDTLVLGRYHRRPHGHGVSLARRLSGGRIVPGGDGFVGLGLALPHRSALVGDDPRALGPEQVMNRCVRGLLDGLRRLGVEPFYPGRDLVTAGGRTLAVLGLEIGPDGTALFEATLAVGRDLAALSALLERADPEGVTCARFWQPAEVVSVGALTRRTCSLEDVAGVVAQGYHDLFQLHFTAVSTPAVGAPEPGWLDVCAPRRDLDRSARLGTMLGAIEVHARRDAGGAIAAIQLAGDFLASSTSVARLEEELVGVTPTAGAVHARVVEAFAGRDEFLLGVEPRELTDTILRAFA